MDSALIAPVVFAAALAIGTAVTELRSPGSARVTWGLVRDRTAVAAGAVVMMVVTVTGGGWSGLAWGVLAGVLTGHLVHRAPPPATSSAGCSRLRWLNAVGPAVPNRNHRHGGTDVRAARQLSNPDTASVAAHGYGDQAAVGAALTSSCPIAARTVGSTR